MLAVVSDWFAPLGLIFGGCCSNALTLEQLTSLYPDSGHIITFAQYLLVSLRGLPNLVSVTYPSKDTGLLHYVPIPHLKRPRIPLRAYIIQVVLFLFVSILNNMAFAYKIPMPVHIIFRSGGLVVSMCLGWLVMGRKYTLTQVLSVLLVTAGVIITTYSASQTKNPSKSGSTLNTTTASTDTLTYFTGIAILALALLCSGFLGLAQDRMYSKYTRPSAPEKTERKADEKPQWQESMFYLHFLAMPMFWFVREDLGAQLASVASGPRIQVNLDPTASNLLVLPPPLSNTTAPGSPSPASPTSLSVPVGLLSLVLTTITSLVCISGVHRLTARVSSLTVTLVLTVRKAVSLMISVLFFKAGKGQADMTMMWLGAALVGVGTVGYTIGGSTGKKIEKEKKTQ
ncbi:UAA transporter [Gloeophyllum trabeum ATCC 11539]|uniref:UAA transporter n=1 Tax=Gloeophyllum trabeum (strain ATCC 11539 / FP-39264 / Madison 617) TaxID=670483 RepID=S7RXM4_GLOTA|nr:UAA transporter [Gloeophyllum trabeum ATCC 11539]EPQ59680.1 UAA transporter [Gloeophyllum trabeum ATCC 11539]